MKKKNYLIVFNPQSGIKGQNYHKKLTMYLNNKSISCSTFITQKNVSSDEEHLKKQLNNFSDVISIGGDGTLNLLSNVLENKNIPLGIVPCGTGNDFSKNIYNKGDDIIAIVTGDKVSNVDLGWCNDRYFINILGVGYDAMVAKASSTKSKIMFRSLFYLWNALKFLPLYKEEKIQLESESFNKNEPTFLIAFGNGAFFGSGMNITPRADITDGILDCCWVGKLGFIKKCICLIKIFSGSHLLEHNIEYVKAKQFQVSSENHPIEADGEFIGYTPATIRIEEKALLLKVP